MYKRKTTEKIFIPITKKEICVKLNMYTEKGQRSTRNDTNGNNDVVTQHMRMHSV